MKTKVLLAILLVIIVTGGLAVVKTLQFKKMIAAAKAAGAPAETVSSVVVRADQWQETLTAIGSITAVQGVTIVPEIAGKIVEIAFESGATVKRGDVLLRLDISTEEAQLRAIKAQLDLARINLRRSTELRKDNTVSQADLDGAVAGAQQLEASADGIQAVIDKKTIRAPFDGQLGIRQVNLGQYLEAGKAIVSLQSLTPVYADFSLPQQELARLREGLRVRVTTDAYPGQAFTGRLTAMNPDLDASMRSIGLQATFDNPGRLLRPGMFARVEVLLPRETPVITIPATAVLSAPYGDSVFVIETAAKAGQTRQTVRQQFIRVGAARGDFLSVQSGLKPGERIVSSGVFKLRNGASVIENNELSPPSQMAPHPADS